MKAYVLSLLVSYFEAEDDRPEETENELFVPFENVLRSNVDEVDLLVLEELEALVEVLELLDLNLWRGVDLAELLVGDDLQQRSQLGSVLEVDGDILHLGLPFGQVRVGPALERLLLHEDPVLRVGRSAVLKGSHSLTLLSGFNNN